MIKNMADSLNPFYEEENFTESEIIQEPDDDNVTISDLGLDESPPEKVVLNWDAVAVKLLKDKFLLTSLELHSELLEAGRELPRLRDFFSNPANFERTKPVQDLISPPGLRKLLSNCVILSMHRTCILLYFRPLFLRHTHYLLL